jgi:hypothetical protein
MAIDCEWKPVAELPLLLPALLLMTPLTAPLPIGPKSKPAGRTL